MRIKDFSAFLKIPFNITSNAEICKILTDCPLCHVRAYPALKGSQSANKVSNVVSYLLSETMSSLPKESEALPSQSAGDIPQQEPTADARLVIPELSLDFNC